MSPAPVITPKLPGLAGLLGAVAPGELRFTKLNAFVASARNSRPYRSRTLNSRKIARSTVRKPGRSRRFLGELPSIGAPVTTAFRANAAMLNHSLAPGWERCGSPTSCALSLFVPSRFASAPLLIVNGSPLCHRTIGETDQPFSTACTALLPPYEWLGCHTADTATACR